MEFGPNQVHMVPFGLIFSQNGSYMVWDASGMPPGLQNPPKNPKIKEIREIAAGWPLRAYYTGLF